MKSSKHKKQLLATYEDIDNVLKCLLSSSVVFSEMTLFMIPINELRNKQKEILKELNNYE